MRHRIRAAGIVLEGGGRERVLMVRGADLRTDPWQLPGGRVEGRESLTDCVIRELREETGLEVVPERLVYVRQAIDRDTETNHAEFFFLACAVGGSLIASQSLGGEPVTGARFMAREELKGQVAWPLAVMDRLWDDIAAGFPSVVDLGATYMRASNPAGD